MLSCILFYVENSFSQTPQLWAEQYFVQKPDSLNPDLAVRMMDSAIAILYPNDSLEGGPKRDFDHYKEFAKSRYPIQFDSIPFPKAYWQARLNAKQNILCNGTYSGTWTNIGPENDKSYQNQGWVSDIWVNPSDVDNIIVGSEGGGLFKTTDGGGNWQNITDNALGIGCLGISSFAVNPFNYDEIYFTTFNWGHYSGTWRYAMGVWHTTNGGSSWSIVSSFPATATPAGALSNFLYATKVAYLPYTIGGDSYVVISIENHVCGRKGSGPWIDLTPAGINSSTGSGMWLTNEYEINDFDFPQDFPSQGYEGTIIASSGFDDYKQSFSGVYKITINTTTGNPTSPPGSFVLFNAAFNGLTFNVGGATLGYNGGADFMTNFTTEYIGNGNFFTIGQGGTNSIFKWNISNPGAFTYIIQDLYNGSSFMNKMKCKPTGTATDPNIIYIGSNFNSSGSIVYNDIATGWEFKELPFSHPRLHLDTRNILIYHSVLNINDPGQDDIVFYGNDGGLSKITNMKVNNVFSTTYENMNGNGLFIADMMDVDNSEGKGITGAAWHNGYYSLNKMNNSWVAQILGDGVNAKVDKRFTTPNNFRLIFKTSDSFGSYGGDFLNTTTTPPSMLYITNPEVSLWRYSPIHFVGTRMDFGLKQSWYSAPNAYGTPWTKYFSSGSTLITKALNSDRCLAFQVAPSNPDTAYNMLEGTGPLATWSLAQGIYNGLSWDWYDRTEPSILLPIYSSRYSDLAIDSKNANRIFVSYAGVNWNNPGKDRVHVSNDGGLTFTDMSSGLSELPVNCLSYQSGSDDIIYAGTDAGVYYWDKPQGCWVPMGDIPDCIVMRMSIDYCNDKLLLATHGRGIWEGDLYHPMYSIPPVTDIISTAGTTTWNTNKFIEGSILIRSGSRLRITGTPSLASPYTSTTTIYMPKLGAIYVERGAALEVNGAEITNECQFWYGIQAEGDAWPQSYTPGTFSPHQGVVILSKAILSNAEEAFTNSYNYHNGGIVQASSSIFYNNWRSAQFLAYQNWSNTAPPAVLSPDLSYFRDCKFIVNDITPHGFNNHITMHKVNGIDLSGNEFRNDQNLEQSHRSAIGTLDASYHLHDCPSCPPFANNSTVFGFYEGVRSDAFSLGLIGAPIRIENTIFDANEISLHLTNMHYPKIISNDIRIGAKQTPVPTVPYQYYSLGSLLQDVSNFVYCGNAHTKPWNPPSAPPLCFYQYTTGTEIHNSGDIDQDILNNSYHGLKIGNDCDYTCGSTTMTRGINFCCNSNNANEEYDFIFQANPIIRSTQEFKPLATGIAAGNTFTNPPPSATFKHWWQVGGNSPVRYLYNPTIPAEIPTLYTPGNLNPISTPNYLPCNTQCRSLKVNKAYDDELSSSEFQELKDSFYSYQYNYDNYNSLFHQLIDEGSTPGILEDIENSDPSEAEILRARMLALSPYVSLDALYSLANQGTLPNVYLLEVIMANPEASRNEQFIEFLRNSAPSPFPEFMITLIQNSWQGATLRSALENNISSTHGQMTNIQNDILTISRVMSTFFNEDSIFSWMQKVPSLRNSYSVIEYLLNKKDYQQSLAILNSLPLTFNFSELDELEYSSYTALYNFKKNLLENNIEINQLDSTRITQLKEIADIPDYCFPRAMARSALCFFYNICYSNGERNLPEVPQNRFKPLSDELTDESKSIVVYPNPARDYVAFYYKLDNKNEVKEILVADIMGKPVYRNAIKGSTGQHVWNTEKIADGQYIYSINTTSGEKYSGKITIQK
jgi:hypothetical protein